MQNKYFQSSFVLGAALILGCVSSLAAESEASKEKVLTLESRVFSLENYVETIQPNLVEFSNSLHTSIKNYTEDLENSLNNFSRNIQSDLDERFKQFENKRVILNIASKAYQKIDTNSGPLLISIDEYKALQNGYRLKFQIGNLNFADFKDLKLRLFWGRSFDNSSQGSYEQWRQGLNGAEYKYPGTLAKGTWTPLDVDLTPASLEDLAYIECEIEVASVELQIK